MDDDSNVQIKAKGQRKSKKKQDPEETLSMEEQHAEVPNYEEEEHVEEEPKPKVTKKAPAKKSTPKVETEDYDIEQQPDVIIHKRHKGAKPRKIIVITGDSEADDSDEDLPYRAKPKIEVKKREAPKRREPEPEPEPAPKPKPAPKPRKQNVGLVTEKPQVIDAGKGLPQRYADVPKRQGFVVDEFIDKLLGL
jgi:hypothetical protein